MKRFKAESNGTSVRTQEWLTQNKVRTTRQGVHDMGVGEQTYLRGYIYWNFSDAQNRYRLA
jgi:hypothetical protein